MFTTDRLVPMTRPECIERLQDRQYGLGRVGFDDGQPTILPVNYVIDGDAVVIRSAEGSKLDAAVLGEVVAFQVDDLTKPATGRAHGWSVLVRGRANVVANAEEKVFLSLSRLEPSAGGVKPHFIRIPMDQITGRRF